MRLLELFSGTKSVSKAMSDYEIVSVDILSKYHPTHTADILEWDYKQYPSGYFTHIWASPPCTEYSILKHNTGMPTDIEAADRIVLRTFEIIDYFKPAKWFIENPQTGLLKKRPFMTELPFIDVDYCRFSDWGYRKRTRIWTNANKEDALCQKAECPNMIGKYHKASFAGKGRPKPYKYINVPAGDNAYRIPERLIHYLFADS